MDFEKLYQHSALLRLWLNLFIIIIWHCCRCLQFHHYHHCYSLLSLSPFSSLSSTGSRLRRNSDGMLAECLLHRCPLLGPLLLLVLLINRCSFSSWPTILHFLAFFRGKKNSHNLKFFSKIFLQFEFSSKIFSQFEFFSKIFSQF